MIDLQLGVGNKHIISGFSHFGVKHKGRKSSTLAIKAHTLRILNLRSLEQLCLHTWPRQAFSFND